MKAAGTPSIRTYILLVVFASTILLTPTMEAQTRRSAKQRGIEIEPVDIPQKLPGNSKRWALIIGIDRYDDSNINQLSGAVKDAKALEQALIKYAGFEKEHIIRLTSDQPKDLQPNRANIKIKMNSLKKLVEEDGLLLFSFSGHGISGTDGNEAFLLPSDVKMINDIDYLTDEALSVTKIKEYINRIGVKQRIFLLDACRDNPTGRGGGGTSMTKAFARGFNFDKRNDHVNAFMALYATGIGQKAYENQRTSMGYFTEAIVEGLGGEAADRATGEVTLGRLKEYIRETVRRRTILDRGEAQEPWVQSEGYADELVLAKVPVANTKPTADPSSTVVTRTPPSVSNAAGTISPNISNMTSPAPDPALKEEMDYAKIRNSKSREDLEAFLKKYPGGIFAKQVQTQLLALTPAPALESEEIRIERKSEPALNGDPKGSPKAQKRKDGVLFVITNLTTANVTINALNFHKQGQTEAGEFRAELSPGDYDVEVTADKHSTFTGKASVKRGEATPIKVELIPTTGSILIASVDPDAEIHVDGRKLTGVTRNAENQIELLDVPVGVHAVRITHPTMVDWQRESIDVQGGAVTRVTPRFERTVTFSPAFADYFKEGMKFWDAPARWQVRPDRLIVRSFDPGLLQKTYKDFRMELDISFANGLGAAWIVRARDEKNYYVFQLTGPKSAIPNIFRGYICRNGMLTQISSDIQLDKDLIPPGKPFRIIVEAERSAIKHSIQLKSGPKVGDLRLLSTLSDITFSFGRVGFLGLSGEEFNVYVVQITPTK